MHQYQISKLYLHYYLHCLLTLMVHFETEKLSEKCSEARVWYRRLVTRAGRSCKLMRIFTVIVTTSAQLTL